MIRKVSISLVPHTNRHLLLHLKYLFNKNLSIYIYLRERTVLFHYLSSNPVPHLFIILIVYVNKRYGVVVPTNLILNDENEDKGFKNLQE